MPHKKQLSSSMIHGYHHLLVPGSSDPNNNGSSSSLNAATTSPRQRTESSRSQIPTDISIMKNKDKLDIRAQQRTFEGAYVRTALGQLSFALVILKIFSREFIPIGTVFTGYGVLVLLIAWYRRSEATRLFLINHPHHPRNNPDESIVAETEERSPEDDTDPDDLVFVTSGMTVALLTIASVLSYIALLVLLYLM